MGEFSRKADGRRVFTPEFKRGVVQQILKGEKTIAELSRELDIYPTVLRTGVLQRRPRLPGLAHLPAERLR
jgi:transposase-like protein